MNPGRVTVIAEAGVNHNGDRKLALDLIDAAHAAGADVVKFQTFSADRIVMSTAPKAQYQMATTETKESQFDMLRKLELSREDHFVLVEHAQRVGIAFLSTPFDRVSLAFLVEELGMKTVKLPSSDLTNLPLVLDAARSGAKLIMSTGMASLGEIERAVNIVAFGMTGGGTPPADLGELDRLCNDDKLSELLRQRLTLMHCTSEYPSPASDANLRAITTLSQAFDLAVGYSDHTEGAAVALAAVALGASVIEKHLTLDRTMAGPDHTASCEPDELSQLVNGIRAVEASLGGGRKVPTPREFDNRFAMRKGLFAARDIQLGQVVTDHDVQVLRPVSGAGADAYWNWVGRTAPRAFAAGDPLGD